MNRDHYEIMRQVDPGQVQQYVDYMTDGNVRIISEDVTRLIKERYPTHPPYKIADESIRNAMWQVYQGDLQHNQVMIQMVINLFSQQVIIEKEEMDTAHYDPHIQDAPELLGLHFHNPAVVRLNERKTGPIQFTPSW